MVILYLLSCLNFWSLVSSISFAYKKSLNKSWCFFLSIQDSFGSWRAKDGYNSRLFCINVCYITPFCWNYYFHYSRSIHDWNRRHWVLFWLWRRFSPKDKIAVVSLWCSWKVKLSQLNIHKLSQNSRVPHTVSAYTNYLIIVLGLLLLFTCLSELRFPVA